MARRKRSRRRSFNLRRVRVTDELAVGALASLDVVSAAMTAAVTDPLRVISANLTWSLADLGALDDDAQEFGIAHSDYQANEIEEALEAVASIDLGNKLAQEQANRLVRSVGQFVDTAGTGGGLGFNDGRPMKTKLNWLLSTGDSLSMWIRNGSGAVYTTGATVVVLGDLWVKDSV